MIPTRPLALAAVLLLQTGCVVHSGQGPSTGGPPPSTTTGRAPVPPPVQSQPAPARLMTQGEAEGIALKMAADRGYQEPRFHEVQWKQGHSEWKIDVRGDVEGREAKLQMRLDARDGRIVELKDKRGGKPEHAGEHGKGHGKDKDKKDKEKGDHDGDRDDQDD